MQQQQQPLFPSIFLRSRWAVVVVVVILSNLFLGFISFCAFNSPALLTYLSRLVIFLSGIYPLLFFLVAFWPTSKLNRQCQTVYIVKLILHFFFEFQIIRIIPRCCCCCAGPVDGRTSRVSVSHRSLKLDLKKNNVDFDKLKLKSVLILKSVRLNHFNVTRTIAQQ